MEKYKVIGVDNLDRETVSDILIEDNLTKERATEIAETHNTNMRDHDPWYYKVVPQDHELHDHTTLY